MPNVNAVGGEALENMLRLAKEDLYFPILYVYTLEEEELPFINVWGPKRVREFVEDAAYLRESWVLNQDVVCSHEIIRVESAEIIKGVDSYGSKKHEVKNVYWTSIDQIPSYLMPKTAEYIMAKIGWKAEKIRTALAYIYMEDREDD